MSETALLLKDRKNVGPFISKLVTTYKGLDCNTVVGKITRESIINALMSRETYRIYLEFNYPDLYKEFKETDFSYMDRLR